MQITHRRDNSQRVPPSDISLFKDGISLASTSSTYDSSSINEDGTGDINNETGDTHHCSDELWLKIHKFASPFVTQPSSQPNVRKVSDLSTLKHRNPNTVIWNTYASTSSFKAITGYIIKTQAVVRKWLVYKVYAQVKQLRNDGATKIQSFWRGVACRSKYLVALKDVTRCQSFVRHYLVICKVQARMVTRISSAWRKFRSMVLYKSVVKDVTMVQSLVRRYAAQRKRQTLKCLRDVAAATAIQRQWKTYMLNKQHVRVQNSAVRLQCFVRRMIALAKLDLLREERRILEAEMATVISSRWKRFYCRAGYKRIVMSVILVQSLLRKFMAQKEFKNLKHEINMVAATVIQTKWRSHSALMRYATIQRSTVILQCLARQRKAYREVVCKGTMSSIIVCQSFARRLLACKMLRALKHQRIMTAATCIESNARKYLASRRFLRLKFSVILVQSLARSLASSKHLDGLKEQRQILEAKQASKIAAVWKGYSVRESFALVLSAARKHQRRFAAAAIIQATWMAVVVRRKFRRMQESAIKIQIVIRMKMAMIRLMKMKHKIVKASTYHSEDCFVYAKSRVEASTKIQATCRMHILRKRYHANVALTKVKTAHLKRYATRINRVTRGNQNPYQKEEPLFHPYIEVDLEQHQTACLSF